MFCVNSCFAVISYLFIRCYGKTNNALSFKNSGSTIKILDRYMMTLMMIILLGTSLYTVSTYIHVERDNIQTHMYMCVCVYIYINQQYVVLH